MGRVGSTVETDTDSLISKTRPSFPRLQVNLFYTFAFSMWFEQGQDHVLIFFWNCKMWIAKCLPIGTSMREWASAGERHPSFAYVTRKQIALDTLKFILSSALTAASLYCLRSGGTVQYTLTTHSWFLFTNNLITTFSVFTLSGFAGASVCRKKRHTRKQPDITIVTIQGPQQGF